MKTLPRLAFAVAVAMLAFAPATVHAVGRDTRILEDALDVLDSMASMPMAGVLRDAQGVAIIPGVIKAGFVIGGRHGRGVLLTRNPDGAWGRPEFITLSGGSIGWQVGVQSTDVVLVFRTRRGLEHMRKGKLTLGADVAVAAGPIGRQAEAGTDVLLQAEIYSYSRTRGLFAGLSLEGGALLFDPVATAAYYRQEPAGIVDPRTNQVVPVTPPSVRLQVRLAQLTAPPPPPPVPVVVPPPVAVPAVPPPVVLPVAPTPIPRP